MALGVWLSSFRKANASLSKDLEAFWPMGRSPAANAFAMILTASTISLVAVLITTFSFTETKFVAALMLGLIGGAGFLVCGNRRLFALYGVVMLAPLKLGKDFMPIGHQGGAGSFVIDAGDPFLLMLMAYQFNDWRQTREQGYRIPLIGKLWLFMIALGVLTIALGPFRISAAHEVVRMGKYLLFFLVIVNEIKRRKQFRHIAFGLLVGVLIQSTFSIASYASGSQFGLEFLGEETEDQVVELGAATLKGDAAIRRPGGLMGHPNQFAGYLALIMPIGVALLFSPIGMLFKILFTAAVLVGQVALLLTLSRSGWICYSAALSSTLVLSFFHRSSRRRFLLARALVISMVALIALAASPTILQRIQYSDPNSWKSRMEFVEDAATIISDKPILGVGLNSYIFAQAPYTRFQTFEEMQTFYGENVPVVHSTWLLTWAEQGTVGMLAFVLIHVLVLIVGVNNLKIKDGFLHALNVGLLSGFGAIMLDGLVSFFARMEVGGRMFWFAIALILAIGYWRREFEGKSYPSQPPAAEQSRPRRVWMAPYSRARDTWQGWLG